MNANLRRLLQPPWVWLIALVILTIWGLTDVRSRGRYDPADLLAHKTDLTCYTEAAKAFFDGRNPYTVANPRGWHYLYPPLFAILLAPLAQFDTQTQVVIWFFFNLLATWGCYRESRRIVALMSDSQSTAPGAPKWLTWIAALTMALPVLNTLQRGQVGILVGYLLLLGFRLVVGCKSWRGAALGGIVLAAAINLKLTPALPAVMLVAVLMLAVARRGFTLPRIEQASGTAAGILIGLGLFFLALPAAAVGWNANLHHLNTWVGKVVFNSDLGGENDLSYRSVRNQSLLNAASSLGNWLLADAEDSTSESTNAEHPAAQPAAAAAALPMERPLARRALMIVRLTLLVLLAGVGWQTGSRATRLDLATAFGMACTASLLVSPLSWAHHYPVGITALLAVPLWHWQQGRPTLATALAASACATMWIHYLLLDYAGRAGVLGLGTTAWFVVAAVGILWTTASGQQQIERSEPRAGQDKQAVKSATAPSAQAA